MFTADEVWENIPRGSRPTLRSQFTSQLSLSRRTRITDLIAAWNRLFAVRERVLGELEKARTNKLIGSSLEATVVIRVSGPTYELLKQYERQLRYVFIVSQVSLAESQGEEIEIQIEKANGAKCERCWNYSTRVGEFERYPTVCERCAAALEEIENGLER